MLDKLGVANVLYCMVHVISTFFIGPSWWIVGELREWYQHYTMYYDVAPRTEVFIFSHHIFLVCRAAIEAGTYR